MIDMHEKNRSTANFQNLVYFIVVMFIVILSLSL